MSEQKNTFGLLGSVMDNAGSSFDQAYKTLTKTMEQTLQARQLTSLAMEQIYKANVKIDSHIEAEGNGRLKVLFTLGNLSPFPMKSVKGNLKLEDSKIEIGYKEEAKIIDESNLETHKSDNLFDTPIDLQPQMEYEQSIELSIKQVIQSNGMIEVSFINLMNESTPVQIRHEFGIYLIDQLTRKVVKEFKKDEFDGIRKEEYSSEFIRELLGIHPVKGIEIGMKLEFTDNCKNSVIVEIIEFSSNYESVIIEAHSNNDTFLSMFITELDKLNK
ncbi:hypothetical protein G6F37_000221 [Rhizopus arrhizus]|nr:hypothetical protein G6F38_000567 [Rhizopus arrhizus]KAG1164511.1 hypothetical protein G6F37_000221 [Rhizopus arrhizus]